MEFYYFNYHFTTIMQGCYNSARLWTPCTNCHNLVTTLQSCSKVVVISVWVSSIWVTMCSYGTQIIAVATSINTFVLESRPVSTFNVHINWASMSEPHTGGSLSWFHTSHVRTVRMIKYGLRSHAFKSGIVHCICEVHLHAYIATYNWEVNFKLYIC